MVFYTFRKNVKLKAGQIIGYLKGQGYYAKSLSAPAPKPDPVVKPKPPALTKYERLVQVALSQLGTKESPPGSNDQKYGVWYPMNGQPWCAIFQSWCAQGLVEFKFSYVPAVVTAARSRQLGLKVLSDPTTGCFACYDWNGDGTADHIGVVADEALLVRLVPDALKAAKEAFGPLGSGDFWSVEGNTGVGNDSNGGEVMLRKRPRSLVQAFVLAS